MPGPRTDRVADADGAATEVADEGYSEAYFGRKVLAACGGSASIDPHYLSRGDLDDDGLTDWVLDWGGVTCNDASPAIMRGAGFCGAALCSVDVYRGNGAEVAGFLGMGGWVEKRDGVDWLVTAPHLMSCETELGQPCLYVSRFGPDGTLSGKMVVAE